MDNESWRLVYKLVIRKDGETMDHIMRTLSPTHLKRPPEPPLSGNLQAPPFSKEPAIYCRSLDTKLESSLLRRHSLLFAARYVQLVSGGR